MGKAIEKSVVRQVALLSRLELSDSELDTYSKDISDILSYISKLRECDTKDAQPTSHVVTTLKNVFRKDDPKPSLDTDEALLNAPGREGDFFKVPRVI